MDKYYKKDTGLKSKEGKNTDHFFLSQRWYSYFKNKGYCEVWYFENEADMKEAEATGLKGKEKNVRCYDFDLQGEITEVELKDKVLKKDIHKGAKKI